MSQTMNQDGNQIVKKATVAAGANEVVYTHDLKKATVGLFPGSGATAKGEYSTSGVDSVVAGTAEWSYFPHGSGGVTADAVYSVENPVSAVRFSSVTAGSTFEINYLT